MRILLVEVSREEVGKSETPDCTQSVDAQIEALIPKQTRPVCDDHDLFLKTATGIFCMNFRSDFSCYRCSICIDATNSWGATCWVEAKVQRKRMVTNMSEKA